MLAWGAAADTDEASLAGPSFASCCVARALTGHRQVLVHGPGIGDLCSREIDFQISAEGLSAGTVCG